MAGLSLVNETTRQLVCSQLEVALAPAERMRGLLGRPSLPAGSGLLIKPCNSIHTWFMKFAIDVAFLDAEGRVCRIVRGVKPFRLAAGGLSARSVLETASGGLPEGLIRVGDALEIVPMDAEEDEGNHENPVSRSGHPET